MTNQSIDGKTNHLTDGPSATSGSMDDAMESVFIDAIDRLTFRRFSMYSSKRAMKI